MDKLPSTLPTFFWHFIKKQKWQFLVLFASTSATVIAGNVLPYAIKQMVDAVSKIGSDAAEVYQSFMSPACMFIGTWLIMLLIFRAQEWVYTSAIPEFRKNIRMTLFEYMQG